MRYLLCIYIVLALVGCNDPDDAYKFPNATMKWGDGYAWNDSLYDAVGEYSMFQSQFINVFNDSRFSMEELRDRNPDILVGAYIQAHAVAEWQIKHLNDRTPSFAQDWARMGLANLAYTTEGDTARCFNNAYRITTQDSATVDEMVAVLRKWVDLSPNGSFDGLSFMVDYCTVPAETWVYGLQRQQMQGELDLDRDGIPHPNDPVEQEMLRNGYVYYVEELRKSMPNIKILANGRMPYQDLEFASLLDGMFVEGGFRWWDQGAGGALFGPDDFQTICSHFRTSGYSVIEPGPYSRYGLAMAMMFDTPGHRVFGIVKPVNGTATLAENSCKWWSVGTPEQWLVRNDHQLIRACNSGAEVLDLTEGTYPTPFKFAIYNSDNSLKVKF